MLKSIKFTILLFLCLIFINKSNAQLNPRLKQGFVHLGLSSSLIATPLILKTIGIQIQVTFIFLMTPKTGMEWIS